MEEKVIEQLKDRLKWLQEEEKKTRQIIENHKIRLISLLGGKEEISRLIADIEEKKVAPAPVEGNEENK